MSERSVQCPDCYAFARLVDAGGYRAYRCPQCEWSRPTDDTRPGNRPADVCALCDRPGDLTSHGTLGMHLYVGPGWVHGGGREHIPVHNGCLWFERIDYLLGVNSGWQASVDYFLANVASV